jgi:hypothetical protein
MSLRSWFSFAALTSIVAGVAIALYAPPIIEAYSGIGVGGLPTQVVHDPMAMTAWTAVGLVRVLGALLFSLGLVLWQLRDALRPEAQARVLRVLLIGFSLALALGAAQQYSSWSSALGWISLGAMLALLASGVIVYRRLPPQRPIGV